MVLFRAFWKSLIWERISRGSYSRGGRHQNHPFAPAYLGQLFIGDVGLGSETVGFINKNVLVLVGSPFDQLVELTQGFKIGMDLEIGKNIGPGAGCFFPGVPEGR